MPVAVCRWTRRGKWILWTDGAERVTGYLRQDGRAGNDLHCAAEAVLETRDTDNNDGGEALPLVEACGRERADVRACRCGRTRSPGNPVGVMLRTVLCAGMMDECMERRTELLRMITEADDRRHNKVAVAGCGTNDRDSESPA